MSPKSNRRHIVSSRRLNNAGFTLAEMAIVVLLIGIMLTMGLGVLKAQADSAAYSATNKKQAAIKDALVAYQRTNWRLPCPDTNLAAPGPDGAENRVGAVVTGACTANFGVVPYVTLGLPREMALDGWENYMSYHVSNWTQTVNFDPIAVGTIVVNSRPPSAAALSINAMAVIVSHGKNGYGAYTIKGSRNILPATADPLALDEQENTNANLTYYKREFTDVQAATGGAFDDVVMFLQADDLLTPLRIDGSLKAQSDGLAAIQNSVVALSFASCQLPAAFVPVGQVYGSAVTYTRLFFPGTVSLATTPTNTPLFRLTVGAVPNNISLAQVSSIYAGFGKCP